MLAFMTMTGIDERTDLERLSAIVSSVPIEFGILRSPKAGLSGQSTRYPMEVTIDNFVSRFMPDRLAFHLCGGYARMVHDEQWDDLCREIDFSAVGRVQVNAVGADAADILRLQRFSVRIQRPVIMQWRDESFPCVPGLHLLQDRSGGRGVEEKAFAIPNDLCMVCDSQMIGYAGGLNQSNVQSALWRMERMSRGKNFWIDAESGLRTDDWFDIEKAEAFATAVARGPANG